MALRETNIEKLQTYEFDTIIIGGGINGAVSAAALSARGAKVALIDKGDFAGFTSQESSNLAWGGIKYMESLEFLLVRKLCKSRNHLIESYPSTVQEIRFLATIEKGFRWPVWFLYMGAWLYWLMGSFFTRIPLFFNKKSIEKVEPVINTENSVGGFEYSDAYLHDNDARFVFNFIRNALNMGCIAVNYMESTNAKFENGKWNVTARENLTGKEINIKAKTLINAAGPFVDLHNSMTGAVTTHKHALSKGIHLIVNRLTPNHRVLAFFADDGRLFFVIPMGARTCIGTTDTKVENPVTYVTEEDRDFVLENINKRLDLDKPLTREDIIAERCGVRPLAVETGHTGESDWVQLSRKHAIDIDKAKNHISIFGGKLTDCLNVGDEITEEIESFGISLPYRDVKWYGEPDKATHEDFLHRARLMNVDALTSEDASEPLTSRLWRRYGLQAMFMLDAIRQNPKMADILIDGTEYTRVEIEYAARSEMIVKLDDFLRRRSKIALVAQRDSIKNSKGLREACAILFGTEAEAKFTEYFSEESPTKIKEAVGA